MSKEHSGSCRPGYVTKVRGDGSPVYVRPYGSRTRFFMIDRRREGEKLCEEFKVLGSTGNVRWDQSKYSIYEDFSLCCCCWQVYTVTISRLPSCDCAYIVYSLYFFLATPANSPPRPRRDSWQPLQTHSTSSFSLMARSLTCVPLQLFIYLKGNSLLKRFQPLMC